MNPTDFIKTANSLKSSREEADRRSSVSRAYYAVFNYIRFYLESQGINVPRSSAHDKIQKYLKNSGLQIAEDIGKRVDELEDDRVEADYKLNLDGPDSNYCLLNIIKAQQVIQDFNSCKGTALINGIKQYQRVIGNFRDN
jgi:uncharacterized protein (UPF0332 family)